MRGENLVVSTGSDIRNEDEVADDAINASLVLEKMQSAGNRMNLVILDACRNNPFAVKSRSAANGLATMNAPIGTLVAYATAPGSVASDGSGSNGLYTEHLAQAIMQPGVPVEDVFKQVRTAVRRASNNQQTPWENTALEGQFYFRPGAALAAAQPASNTTGAGASGASGATDGVAFELAYWDSVKNSKSADELRSYLVQYPNGRFALVAQVRLQALTAPATAPATAAVPGVVKAAPAKMASAWPTRGVVGTLVTTDPRFPKIRTTVDVTADDFEPGQTAYSTGDVIDHQGRVIQALIGNAVAKVTSGALWTVPVRPDARGEATVNVNHPGADDLKGTIRWSSNAVGQNKTQITAEIYYGGRLSLQFAGRWTALFSALIRGASHTHNLDTNYVSAEFTSR